MHSILQRQSGLFTAGYILKTVLKIGTQKTLIIVCVFNKIKIVNDLRKFAIHVS